ncbi:MAG TPA: RNA polymerase sigma-70 factor [Chryseosolibacter sp.]
MPQESLKHLLLKIADGDEKAFRSIFDSYSSKVYRFAMKVTHSSTLAEEVVQDVFIKIWSNRSQLSLVEYFPSYLYTIARNHTFNLLKRIAIEANANAKLVRQLPLHHSDTEQQVICSDYQGLLNQIVDTLPPQQKKVYGLCHHDGLKYEEAAERLNLSRLTVKTHMQNALRTIKSHFGHIIQYCLAIILPLS